MNRRSFLALAAGAPLAAILPNVATANNRGPAATAATAICVAKIEAGSIGCNTLYLTNLLSIREASIGHLIVSGSNISTQSILVERI